jgi:hypothetical protein
MGEQTVRFPANTLNQKLAARRAGQKSTQNWAVDVRQAVAERFVRARMAGSAPRLVLGAGKGSGVEIVFSESGYEWILAAAERRIVLCYMIFLPQELPADVFVDYVGVTQEAAAKVQDLFVRGAPNEITLSVEAESAVRAHLRLLPECLSDRSFEDFVAVPKSTALALERALDLKGYEAARSWARHAAAEVATLTERVRTVVDSTAHLRTYEVMAMLKVTAVNRCHAIEFGSVAEEVGLQESVVDLAFVIAEHYAAQGSLPARESLRRLETLTSRPGLTRAIRGVLNNSPKPP